MPFYRFSYVSSFFEWPRCCARVGSGDGFFRGGRWRDGEELTDRVFEVAYFWRVDPASILALPLERFNLYERQAERLAEQLQAQQQAE